MRHILPIAAALFVLSSICSFAQKPATVDFGAVQDYSPWLTCKNRAGLYDLPILKVVNAQVDAQKTDGAYKDPSESPDCIQGCINTQAYSKVSEKVTFYGDMSYSYFRGHDMGGSVLMNSAMNTINFYEYPNENIGTKTKELYTLNGGLSYRANETTSLGVSGHYESGNYSKRKDPRNLNRWMDLGLSVGTLKRVSSALSLGADLRYQRTVESISSRVYGTTGQNYFYFVDYGASLGKVEVLGADNYFIASSTERPMLNNYLGGGMQIEIGDHTEGVSFFSEVAYTYRKGSYGDKASSEILFTHNNGHELEYHGAVTVWGQAKHNIDIGISYSTNDNYLNSFSVLSNPGENLEVEYYGEVPSQAHTTLSGDLAYKAVVGNDPLLPSWRFIAGLGLTRDDINAYYYPYSRHQRADIACLSFLASHTLVRGKNIIETSANASFRNGTGDKASDSVGAEVYGPAPRTAQEYLDASWEYRTSASSTIGLSLTYSRAVGKGLHLFVGVKEIFGSLIKKPEYLDGRFRNSATISVGCRF